MAVTAAVRAVLPIAEHGAVTLGAEPLRLSPGDFFPKVIDERFSIDRVVAIETSRIQPVRQANARVLPAERPGSILD